jgi:hypothetical protein
MSVSIIRFLVVVRESDEAVRSIPSYNLGSRDCERPRRVMEGM